MKSLFIAILVSLALTGCPADDAQQPVPPQQVDSADTGSIDGAESWKVELRAATGDVVKAYVSNGPIHYADDVKEWHFTDALTTKEVYVNNTWYITMEQQ